MHAFTWWLLGLDDRIVDHDRFAQRDKNLSAVFFVTILGYGLGVIHFAPWGWLAFFYWCCTHLVGIKIYPWFPPYVEPGELGEVEAPATIISEMEQPVES